MRDLVKKAWVLEKAMAPKGVAYESHGLLLIYVTTYVAQVRRTDRAQIRKWLM
jgi:hypothetical protein